MESPMSGESRPRCRLERLLLTTLGLVAIARRLPAPAIALPVHRVRLGRPLPEVLAQLREEVAGRAVVREGDAVVARFAGRAGIFRYQTVELVRFSGHTVTFGHLHGPFRTCDEVFEFVPAADGGHTCEHRGTLVMRGGLLGWLLGILVIRGLFGRHVAQHMQASFGARPDAREHTRGGADPATDMERR
jgi:hypothetical protein